MPEYRVHLQRRVTEWARVTRTADTKEAARAAVEAALADGTDGAHWHTGDVEDGVVIDIEEIEP